MTRKPHHPKSEKPKRSHKAKAVKKKHATKRLGAAVHHKGHHQ